MARSQIRGESVVTRAAAGFTVKSGWACAVLVTGSASAPRVHDSRRVELSDPAHPESRQPYHEGFGTARASGRGLSKLVASVEQFGRRSVIAVFRDYKASGYHLAGVAIVAGSLIDPDTIGNSHVRIHALEGRLFRGVVADAARRSGIEFTVWRERDLYDAAAQRLRQPEARIREVVATLGKSIGGSWRAEHKAAALAAWMLFAG
jgi:hypothetical protein